jgi:hypothetical protein
MTHGGGDDGSWLESMGCCEQPLAIVRFGETSLVARQNRYSYPLDARPHFDVFPAPPARQAASGLLCPPQRCQQPQGAIAAASGGGRRAEVNTRKPPRIRESDNRF